MATRKRAPEGPTLFAIGNAPTEPAPAYVPPVVAERSLRVVPPPDAVPECEVCIEPLDDGRYIVAITRHYGGSVAAVIYTRAQLEMLLRRIPAALEVG